MAAIRPVVSSPVQVPANTDSRSSYLQMTDGRYRIWVSSVDWSGSKVATVKFTPALDDDHLGSLKLNDLTTTISLSENGGVEVPGPGYICIEVSNSNGSPVNLFVNKVGLI